MDTYTHGHAEPVLQSHRWRTAENSAGYLLPSLRPGLDLLDVGCGPGTITVDLAARVAPGPGGGHRRLRRSAGRGAGRRRARRASPSRSRSATSTRSTADDDSFDVVHAHQVLQHLTDPVAALREMARVCRPGGVIAVRDVDYGAFVTFPADAGLDRWLDLYHRVARRNDGRARRRPPAAVVGARGGAARRRRRPRRPGATPRRPSGSGGANSWAGRATASAFAEQAVAYGLATPAELDEIAAAWLRWRDADDGWLGMLHGELLIRV